MRFKSCHLLVFPLLLLTAFSEIPTELGYKHQLIAEDHVFQDAAKKRETVVDSYMCKCMGRGRESVSIPPEDWVTSRIQIVGHLDTEAKTIGGLSAKTLIEGLKQLSNGVAPKKVSFLTCTVGAASGHDGSEESAYLKAFLNELKAHSYYIPEVSIRSSLVSVDQSGRRLTGELICQRTKPSCILWSPKNTSLKWVGKYAEKFWDGTVVSSPVTTGPSAMDTSLVGILPTKSPVYFTERSCRRQRTE